MSSANYAIKVAIDSLDIETARSMLRDALKDADAETYYLASLVALDNEQKKGFLQKALELDPFHEKAHAALGENRNKNSESIQPEKTHSTSNPASVATIDIDQFITANVGGSNETVPMYVIPVETGLIRTQLRKDSRVLLVERDERAEWFMCGYLSPVGQPVIGWIPYIHLKNITYMNSEIDFLDLPITRFEPYNTRAEVQKLIVEKKKKLKSTSALIAQIVFLSIFSLIFNCLGLGMIFSGVLGLLGITFIAMGILFFFLIFKISKQLKVVQEFNLPLNEELKRLDTLQKEIRNEYERLRDDQRITMGFQSGLDTAKNLVGIAGETVAKKILRR